MSETLIPITWLLVTIGCAIVVIIALLTLLIEKTSEADKWRERCDNWRRQYATMRRHSQFLASKLQSYAPDTLDRK